MKEKKVELHHVVALAAAGGTDHPQKVELVDEHLHLGSLLRATTKIWLRTLASPSVGRLPMPLSSRTWGKGEDLKIARR